MNFLARKITLGVSGVAIVGGLWLLLSWNSASVFFPPLKDMIPRAVDYWSSAAGVDGMLSTFRNLFKGLLIGVGAGIGAGLAIGQIRWLDVAITPIIEFIRSIPYIAMLPFAMAVFGIGDAMKVFSIALATAWPVLLSTVDGAREIPTLWRDTARVYGLTRFQQQVHVVLPGLAPRVLAGVHVAIPLSLIVAVTSEMIGSTDGIGSVIINAQYTFEVELMWSGILLLGVVGWTLNIAFLLFERLLSRWTVRA